MYFANFESVMKYGIIFWGRNGLIEKVFVAQKRVLRSIKKMKFRDSCRGIFRNEGILTVHGMYIYECLIFFFNNKDSFNMQTYHGYQTRTLNVNYPGHRLTLTERNPCYMCIKFFNHLPDNYKDIESQKIFKMSIKQMLIDLEPYSLNEYFDR